MGEQKCYRLRRSAWIRHDPDRVLWRATLDALEDEVYTELETFTFSNLSRAQRVAKMAMKQRLRLHGWYAILTDILTRNEKHWPRRRFKRYARRYHYMGFWGLQACPLPPGECPCRRGIIVGAFRAAQSPGFFWYPNEAPWSSRKDDYTESLPSTVRATDSGGIKASLSVRLRRPGYVLSPDWSGLANDNNDPQKV